MYRNFRPGYEKYWPSVIWSPASIDTENSPDAIISGYVSCFGETLAITTGSSKLTCVTQWLVYAHVTPSWRAPTTSTPFIICPSERLTSRSIIR